MSKVLVIGAGPSMLSARALQAMLPDMEIIGIDVGTESRSVEATMQRNINGLIEIVAMRELDIVKPGWKPKTQANRYAAPGKSKHKKGKR